jgi:hypothetical protein
VRGVHRATPAPLLYMAQRLTYRSSSAICFLTRPDAFILEGRARRGLPAGERTRLTNLIQDDAVVDEASRQVAVGDGGKVVCIAHPGLLDRVVRTDCNTKRSGSDPNPQTCRRQPSGSGPITVLGSGADGR